ncbi:unnamed protein product [Prunus brigantina]
MEDHKKRYLRDFLCRTQVNLEYYVEKIKDQEARLRSYYAEPIAFSSDEFLRIILVILLCIYRIPRTNASSNKWNGLNYLYRSISPWQRRFESHGRTEHALRISIC